MADIHPGNEPGSAIRPAAPHAADGHGPVNQSVRFEPTDVHPKTVGIFVGVLTGLLLVLGVFLVGLFKLLDNRERDRNKEQVDLPLAAPAHELPLDGPQLVEVRPGAPRIEGVLPSQEVGRPWARHMELEGRPYWLGYIVRLLPPPEDVSGAGGPARNAVEGREQVEKGVRAADAALGQVAGKLGAAKNAGGPPADVWRQSWGAAASGRNAPRDAVRGGAPKDDKGAKGAGGEENK